MKGLLEPISIEDDFGEAANALNIAAAQGKEFIVTRTVEGDHIALKMDNILTIIERDEEETSDMIAGVG